jgi:hypothetical protein
MLNLLFRTIAALGVFVVLIILGIDELYKFIRGRFV